MNEIKIKNSIKKILSDNKIKIKKNNEFENLNIFVDPKIDSLKLMLILEDINTTFNLDMLKKKINFKDYNIKKIINIIKNSR